MTPAELGIGNSAALFRNSGVQGEGPPRNSILGMRPLSPGEMWLDGEVLACACPQCQAPMSVRLWLMVADCWRCGTSIELTAEQEQMALRLLEERQEIRRSRSVAMDVDPGTTLQSFSEPGMVSPGEAGRTASRTHAGASARRSRAAPRRASTAGGDRAAGS